MRRAASSQVRSSRRHYKCLQHQSSAEQTSKVPQLVASLRTDLFNSSAAKDSRYSCIGADTEQKSKRRPSELTTKRRVLIEQTPTCTNTDITSKNSASKTKLSTKNWKGRYLLNDNNTYFRPFSILSLVQDNSFDDTDAFSKFFELSKIRPRIDEALINGSICHTMNAEMRHTSSINAINSDLAIDGDTATTSEQNQQEAKHDAENSEANKENECGQQPCKVIITRLITSCSKLSISQVSCKRGVAVITYQLLIYKLIIFTALNA